MLYVLDTFALMAYLRREKDFNQVRTIILETLAGKCESHMSVINLGELYYMQSRKGGVIKPKPPCVLSAGPGSLSNPRPPPAYCAPPG